MGKNVHQLVTERIVAKIERAIANNEPLPWQRPFVFDSDRPRNYVTQQRYHGVNCLLLEHGEFLTWNQICDLQKSNPSIHLRKGSSSLPVIYYNVMDRVDDTTGEVKKSAYLRYYNVFSVADVEGIVPHTPQEFHNKIDSTAEELVIDYLNREHICLHSQYGKTAAYSPSSDTITMPLVSQFKSPEAYISTLFHEAAHSTGHEKRLNRNIKNRFGDEAYSKEELVAELSACILSGYLGIESDFSEKNSIAYMRSWLKALKDNVTWIVSASSQAEKAAEYIIGHAI